MIDQLANQEKNDGDGILVRLEHKQSFNKGGVAANGSIGRGPAGDNSK